nr:MAG TPA: hypothetical protein [Caudoviricetes sp.]
MSDRRTSNGSSRPSSEASLSASTVGRTANPYEIGVAYIDGYPLRPLGEVESEPMVFNQPDPDRLRPYIEAFLRKEITLRGRLTEGGEGVGSDDERPAPADRVPDRPAREDQLLSWT